MATTKYNDADWGGATSLRSFHLSDLPIRRYARKSTLLIFGTTCLDALKFIYLSI